MPSIPTSLCPTQAVSIILSFLLFPKPYVDTYLLAGLVFSSGVALNIYRKNRVTIDRHLTALYASLVGRGSKHAQRDVALARLV